MNKRQITEMIRPPYTATDIAVCTDFLMFSLLIILLSTSPTKDLRVATGFSVKFEQTYSKIIIHCFSDIQISVSYFYWPSLIFINIKLKNECLYVFFFYRGKIDII